MPPILEHRPIITRRIARQAYQLSFFLIAGVLLAISTYRLTSLVLVPEITIGYSRSEPQVGALLRAFSGMAEPAALSIRVIEGPDAAGIDKALQQKTIDFAAVQPVTNFPTGAMVVAVLRDKPLFFVTWEASKAKRPEQLSGRRIGIIDSNNEAQDALSKLAVYYRAEDVKFSNIPADVAAIKAEVSSRRIDSLVVTDISLVRNLLAQIAEFKPTLIQ